MSLFLIAAIGLAVGLLLGLTGVGYLPLIILARGSAPPREGKSRRVRRVESYG